MRYKVGDRVKIKSLDWYNKNKDTNGNVNCGSKLFTKEMSKYCEKIMIITYISNLNIIRMGMDNHYWIEDMIEDIVTPDKL